MSSQLVPSQGWYECGGGGDCGPATPVQSTLFGSASTSSAFPQISTSSSTLSVRSRTALDVRFGGALPPVVPGSPSTLRDGGPDMVFAYDTWQYWLAPVSLPTSDAWQTYDVWSGGLPSAAKEVRWLYAPHTGSMPIAMPVLRNPLGLFISSKTAAEAIASTGSGTSWRELAKWVKDAAPRINATGFRQSDWYPEGTESALASVASSGGAVATGDGTAVRPAFRSGAGASGLSTWASIAGASRASASPTVLAHGNVPLVAPQHVWSPLWADRMAWNPPWAFHPLPAGTAGRSVPCTYACCFVMVGNRTGNVAEEFGAFLWSSPAQAILGRVAVGLPLRQQDALTAMASTYLWIDTPGIVADASGDLTLKALFGTRKSDGNAGQIDSVSDGFATFLGQVR